MIAVITFLVILYNRSLESMKRLPNLNVAFRFEKIQNRIGIFRGKSLCFRKVLANSKEKNKCSVEFTRINTSKFPIPS